MKLHLKKPVKILLIVAGSLFGLFLLIAILVSPIIILKNIVKNCATEW